MNKKPGKKPVLNNTMRNVLLTKVDVKSYPKAKVKVVKANKVISPMTIFKGIAVVAVVLMVLAVTFIN